MDLDKKHPPNIFTCEVVAQIIDYVPHALIQLYLSGNCTVQKALIQYVSSCRFKDKRILSLGIVPRVIFDLKNLRSLNICLLSSAPVVIDKKPYPLMEALLLVVSQLDEFALKCYALRRNKIPKDEASTDMGELICLAQACNREMRSFKFSAIEFYNEYGEDAHSELGRSSLWPKFAQVLPRSLYTLSVDINMGGTYTIQDYDFGSWFESLPPSLTRINVPRMLLNHNQNKSLDVWPVLLKGLKNGYNISINPLYYTFRASEGFLISNDLRLVLWLRNEDIYHETQQILTQRQFTHFEVRCETHLYTPTNLTSFFPSSTRAISLHLLNEVLIEDNRNSFDVWKRIYTSHNWASEFHWPRSLTWLKIEGTLSVDHLVHWLYVDELYQRLESLDVRIGINNDTDFGSAQSFARVVKMAQKMRKLRVVFEDLSPIGYGCTYIPTIADYLLAWHVFRDGQPSHLVTLHLDIYLKEDFCCKFIQQDDTREGDFQTIERLMASLSSTLQELEISIWSDVLTTPSINLSWLRALSRLKELRSFRFYICTESYLKNFSINVSQLPPRLKSLWFKIVTKGAHCNNTHLVEWQNLAHWRFTDLESFTYKLHHNQILSEYAKPDVSELATSLPESLHHLVMCGVYIRDSQLRHLPTKLKTFDVPVKNGKKIVLPIDEDVPFLKIVQKLGVSSVDAIQNRHLTNMLILCKCPNLHQIKDHHNRRTLIAGNFISNIIHNSQYGWLTLSERRRLLERTSDPLSYDYVFVSFLIVIIVSALVMIYIIIQVFSPSQLDKLFL
jgi:hypothetical protein